MAAKVKVVTAPADVEAIISQVSAPNSTVATFGGIIGTLVSGTFLYLIAALNLIVLLGKALYHSREMEGGRPRYDLVILDGPAMPLSAAGRKLIDIADGIVAILPVKLDITRAIFCGAVLSSR